MSIQKARKRSKKSRLGYIALIAYVLHGIHTEIARMVRGRQKGFPEATSKPPCCLQSVCGPKLPVDQSRRISHFVDGSSSLFLN